MLHKGKNKCCKILISAHLVLLHPQPSYSGHSSQVEIVMIKQPRTGTYIKNSVRDAQIGFSSQKCLYANTKSDAKRKMYRREAPIVGHK